MEHTASILETDISLITSSLKFFAMFQMHSFHYKQNEEENIVEYIAIKFSNFHISTVLYLNKKS